jgi:hypothetical protein
LVVFGSEVTKILRNSLFTFFTEQGKTGKNGTHGNGNLATYFWYFGILMKNEVTNNSFMGSFLEFIFSTSPIYFLQFFFFFFALSKVGRIVKSVSSAIYRLFRTRLKKIEQKTK